MRFFITFTILSHLDKDKLRNFTIAHTHDTCARDSGVLQKCIPRHVVEWPTAPQLKGRISSRLHYGPSWKHGELSFSAALSIKWAPFLPNISTARRRDRCMSYSHFEHRGRMSTPSEFTDLFSLSPKLSFETRIHRVILAR